MELNLNVPYLGLNNQPVLNADQSVQTIGTHFSMVLASIQNGDPVKIMKWATAIYNGDAITVDSDEIKLLTDIAMSCPLAAILRLQILAVINK